MKTLITIWALLLSTVSFGFDCSMKIVKVTNNEKLVNSLSVMETAEKKLEQKGYLVVTGSEPASHSLYLSKYADDPKREFRNRLGGVTRHSRYKVSVFGYVTDGKYKISVSSKDKGFLSSNIFPLNLLSTKTLDEREDEAFLNVVDQVPACKNFDELTLDYEMKKYTMQKFNGDRSPGKDTTVNGSSSLTRKQTKRH